MNEWSFYDSENVATLTTRQIVEGLDPVLAAYHYADDGMWQFSSRAEFNEADVVAVSLREVFEIDPSVAVLADLPLGWEASRQAPGQPWHRQRSE